jgi:hypothetical protein
MARLSMARMDIPYNNFPYVYISYFQAYYSMDWLIAKTCTPSYLFTHRLCWLLIVLFDLSLLLFLFIPAIIQWKASCMYYLNIIHCYYNFQTTSCTFVALIIGRETVYISYFQAYYSMDWLIAKTCTPSYLFTHRLCFTCSV